MLERLGRTNGSKPEGTSFSADDFRNRANRRAAAGDYARAQELFEQAILVASRQKRMDIHIACLLDRASMYTDMAEANPALIYKAGRDIGNAGGLLESGSHYIKNHPDKAGLLRRLGAVDNRSEQLAGIIAPEITITMEDHRAYADVGEPDQPKVEAVAGPNEKPEKTAVMLVRDPMILDVSNYDTDPSITRVIEPAAPIEAYGWPEDEQPTGEILLIGHERSAESNQLRPTRGIAKFISRRRAAGSEAPA